MRWIAVDEYQLFQRRIWTACLYWSRPIDLSICQQRRPIVAVSFACNGWHEVIASGSHKWSVRTALKMTSVVVWVTRSPTNGAYLSDRSTHRTSHKFLLPTESLTAVSEREPYAYVRYITRKPIANAKVNARQHCVVWSHSNAGRLTPSGERQCSML